MWEEWRFLGYSFVEFRSIAGTNLLVRERVIVEVDFLVRGRFVFVDVVRSRGEFFLSSFENIIDS